MNEQTMRVLRVLSIGQVAERLSVGKTSIERWIRTPGNDFPQPLAIGLNRRGWLEHELDAWLDSRRRGGPRGNAESGGGKTEAAEDQELKTEPH